MEIVYGEFLAGLFFMLIAKKLTGMGAKMLSVNDVWNRSTVKSILRMDMMPWAADTKRSKPSMTV